MYELIEAAEEAYDNTGIGMPIDGTGGMTARCWNDDVSGPTIPVFIASTYDLRGITGESFHSSSFSDELLLSESYNGAGGGCDGWTWLMPSDERASGPLQGVLWAGGIFVMLRTETLRPNPCQAAGSLSILSISSNTIKKSDEISSERDFFEELLELFLSDLTLNLSSSFSFLSSRCLDEP